jgi:predicted SAM-dependent methyltransferase
MLKEIWRKRASRGLKKALTAFRNEWRTFRLHRQAARSAARYATAKNLRINFGCGDRIMNGWVNVDMSPTADLRLDLREPIPLPDSCARMIYAEHFLEHLAYPEETNLFLSECRRLLAPGGRLSVVVPDLAYAVFIYTDHKKDFRPWLEQTFKVKWEDFWFPAWCDTVGHVTSYIFHQNGEHRHLYDAESLSKVLIACGFSGARQRSFDPALDSASREYGSLYVDADKTSDSTEDSS